MDVVGILKIVWPLILIQLALQFYALIDLAKRHRNGL